MNLSLFILTFLVKFAFSVRYEPVMNEDLGLRSCMSDNKFNRVDPSSFMVVTKDGQLFADGTFKFLKDVNGPLKVLFSTERKRMGFWEPGELNRVMVDFCKTMTSEKEPFYSATKTVHTCPFKQGEEINFDMVPVSDKEIDTTAASLGEWKFKVTIFYEKKGKMGDCFITDWEVFEA